METKSPLKTINTFLVGLGHVNRSFLRILEQKSDRLAAEYAIAFRVVAIADSSGVAVNPAGFDPAATRHAKEAGTSVRQMAGYQRGATATELAATLDYDLVLE